MLESLACQVNRLLSARPCMWWTSSLWFDFLDHVLELGCSLATCYYCYLRSGRCGGACLAYLLDRLAAWFLSVLHRPYYSAWYIVRRKELVISNVKAAMAKCYTVPCYSRTCYLYGSITVGYNKPPSLPGCKPRTWTMIWNLLTR